MNQLRIEELVVIRGGDGECYCNCCGQDGDHSDVGNFNFKVEIEG